MTHGLRLETQGMLWETVQMRAPREEHCLGGDRHVTELPCGPFGPCAGGSYPVMSVCCYVSNTVMKTQTKSRED